LQVRGVGGEARGEYGVEEESPVGEYREESRRGSPEEPEESKGRQKGTKRREPAQQD
jgi:hypothetical protein